MGFLLSVLCYAGPHPLIPWHIPCSNPFLFSPLYLFLFVFHSLLFISCSLRVTAKGCDSTCTYITRRWQTFLVLHTRNFSVSASNFATSRLETFKTAFAVVKRFGAIPTVMRHYRVFEDIIILLGKIDSVNVCIKVTSVIVLACRSLSPEVAEFASVWKW